MGSRILVVDHDEAMVEALEAALQREGMEAFSAVDGASALQSFHESRPDAVLLAVQLGDESGIEVCQALREAPRGQLVPILFMGKVEDGAAIQSPGDALSHGGDYFFPLPNDLDYLAGRVRGWTADADGGQTAPLPRSDTLTSEEELPDPPTIELSDFLEFDQESITEHDYSPIPPILRVKGQAESSAEDMALSMVRQGEELRAAGRVREAIEVYAAAAVMYETDEAIGPALALYKLILHLDPAEHEIAWEAGQLAERHGRKADAVEIYRRTADALEARGQLERASFLVEQTVRLRPDDASFRRRLEELELALGVEEPTGGASFDELIAKEIGRSLSADTLDLAMIPPATPSSLPELEHPEVVQLDRSKVTVVPGLAADLEIPATMQEALRSALPRSKTPAEDWSKLIASVSFQETERLPVPEPVEDEPTEDGSSEERPAEAVPTEDGPSQIASLLEPAARVQTGAFEIAPLTMGGWSRLPVWNDLGDAPRSSAPLLSKIPLPTYGETSIIAPARFVPVEGIATSLVDLVRLLARIEEQRATGILEVPGAPRIVFVEGLPVALRGYRAVHGFLTLLLNSGKVDEEACRDLMANNQSERPVEVARLFVRHGLMREQEGTVFLHRHFEDGITALLRQHGTYEFDGSEEVEVVREEIVPEIDDLRRLLIDLLPRVAGQDELLEAVGGSTARIRVSALAEEGPTRDARFLAILDGRYELQEAARLAALPPERAAALAFVYVLFGLATVVTRPRPRSHLGWIPLSQPIASEPVLSAPPRRAVPTKVKPPVDHHLNAAGRLRALADLVNANDYFAILGVTPTSDAEEVREAHERLVELIDPEAVAVDPDLVELAREVQRSLDEARDVLVNPELRAAYQQHLKP